MQAENKFLNQPLEFWAYVKLISQKVGYAKKGEIIVPTIKEVKTAFEKLNLDDSAIIKGENLTQFGKLLFEYLEHRKLVLKDHFEPNLQNLEQGRKLFNKLHGELAPKCPLPMNKQTGEKKAPSYFTGVINMVIESNCGKYECDYDPRELTAFTYNNKPIRSLSRRVDGSFPNVINPIAIWEIKEYYYTTTFGSRVADGVYETQLDGYELKEVVDHLGIRVDHCLMIDDYNTWWNMGKSYLCRIVDMLHMGLVTEVLVGKEVVTRLPVLVAEWRKRLDKQKEADS